jgi:threonine dehydrogenase-like Zn-dependent dehydrogenase
VKAVVWRGKEDVRVEHVPDPELREPTDASICTAACRVGRRSTCVCRWRTTGRSRWRKARPSDPLGADDLVTHVRPLDEAPEAYRDFQTKAGGTIEVVLRP